MAETHLSRTAFERLTKELEDLTTRGRIEIAQTIKIARDMGDLKENADYHAARDDQGRMESRIRQIQAMLEGAIVVDEVASDGKIVNGSVIELRYEGDGDVERFLIGSIEERRDDLTVISPESPLGKALMGRQAGESVEYEAPRGGTLKVEVVTVG